MPPLSGMAIETRQPGQVDGTRVLPDAAFTLMLSSQNDYRLAVSGLPDGYALRAIGYGATDLLAVPLALRGADVPTEIEILVTLGFDGLRPTP
jgi:hypothetical protein